MRRLFVLLVAALAACAAPSGDDERASEEDLTVREANAYFVTQWGPTAFNAAAHPDGFLDCGPTSLVMAGSYLGSLPRPTASTAEGAIRRARDLTRGAPTPMSGPTHGDEMLRGLVAIGRAAHRVANTAAAVEGALGRGHVALIAGDPRSAWGLRLDARGAYLHHYGARGPIPPPADGLPDVDHFGHWVVVFGIAPDGQLIVGDPLSTAGTVRVSAADIDRYFAEWPAKDAAIEIDGPAPAVQP